MERLKEPTTNEANHIQVFQSADGEIDLEVALEHETVWLSQ